MFIFNNFSGWLLKLSKLIFLSIRGRCPCCNEKTLFLNLFRLNDCCENCEINFNTNDSGSWFFLLLIDRAFFIFPMVVMIYFGAPQILFIISSLMIFIIFIIATPIRLGICVAIDYYLEKRFKQNTL